MIEVSNLTKSYGDFVAVDDISFRVEKGEILGFLGPNGAGKTTTMRILTCFMPSTSGKASVAGYDCSTSPLEVRQRVGYLPETAPLYRDMRVREFLNFAASVKGLRGKMKTAKIAEAMELTSITDMSERLIGKLSRGYRQRVGLSQALINDPEVLILDEPTVGLDPKQIIEIRKVIKNLAGKRTVILSTHILPEVSIVCDRVVIINKGKVVAEDTPKNLTTSEGKTGAINLKVEANHNEVEAFLKSFTGVTSVKIDGYIKQDICPYLVETAPGLDLRKELSSAIVNKGWGLLEISKRHHTLEEIFVNLVTDEEKE